jgi:hypothetical protein
VALYSSYDMLINLLYITSITLLGALTWLVYRKAPRSPLHRSFALTCLALISWLATLYFLMRSNNASYLTLIGRLNFASVLLAVTFSFHFVSDLARSEFLARWRPLMGLETAILALVTVFTPLVDRLESVHAGEHTTMIGTLFPLFALHVIAYPVMAATIGLAAMRSARAHVRDQLLLVSMGIMVTAAVNVVTGIILPYGYGIFSFQEVGALSAVVFAGGVAYAIMADRLFDIRVVIRKTVVVAVLVTFVEQVYTLSLSLFVNNVPASETSPLVRHVASLGTVLFIAATFHPLKEWLEKALGRLFNVRQHHRTR